MASDNGAETKKDIALQWYPSGSHLLVDERWRFQPERGSFERLSFRAAGREIIPSPSGTRTIFLDHQDPPSYQIWSGPGSIGEKVRVGQWLKFSEDVDRFFEEYKHPKRDIFINAAFWIDDRQVVLVQSNVHANRVECRLLDAASGMLTTPKNCPYGTGAQTTHIHSGPRNRIAVYSSSEGLRQLSIATFTPEHGMRSIGVPELDFFSELDVHFAQGNDRIDFLTRCDLIRKNYIPCYRGYDAPDGKWYIYSWSPKRSLHLRLTLSCACEKPVWSAERQAAAWVRDGRVCVAEQPTMEPRCVMIPKDGCRDAQTSPPEVKVSTTAIQLNSDPEAE